MTKPFPFRYFEKEKSPDQKMIGALRKAAAYSPTLAVPSAQTGLTSLFGKGRGEPRRHNHLSFGRKRQAISGRLFKAHGLRRGAQSVHLRCTNILTYYRNKKTNGPCFGKSMAIGQSFRPPTKVGGRDISFTDN